MTMCKRHTDACAPLFVPLCATCQAGEPTCMLPSGCLQLRKQQHVLASLSPLQCCTACLHGLRRHTDFVTALDFHPVDDKFFISGSIDGKVCSACLTTTPAI